MKDDTLPITKRKCFSKNENLEATKKMQLTKSIYKFNWFEVFRLCEN